MKKIKKGDIVVRKSHNEDILFFVERIIKLKNGDRISILKGLTIRIEADAPIEDLKVVETEKVNQYLKEDEKRFLKVTQKNETQNIADLDTKRYQEMICTGKILHLDGDRRYAEKSIKYYKKMGLNAIVKNVPEYRQPKEVYRLLQIYKPDILVITGHDAMIKKGVGYNNLYNYRNSKHFIQTVKEARIYDMQTRSNLVIFAGACQSYFEALIQAGANFASSPARILIDFMDPLVVAQKIAITDRIKYVTVNDFVDELRDGTDGVNGIGANGKKSISFM